MQLVLVARSQDFAARFMTAYKSDTTVHCTTISPKMFEEIKLRQGLVKTDEMKEAIENIQSVRIVESSRNARACFGNAETLLQKNRNRFEIVLERKTADESTLIGVRRRNKTIVECVALYLRPRKSSPFMIINLTGTHLDEVMRLMQGKFGGSFN